LLLQIDHSQASVSEVFAVEGVPKKKASRRWGFSSPTTRIEEFFFIIVTKIITHRLLLKDAAISKKGGNFRSGS
jgi:hypothetical protein